LEERNKKQVATDQENDASYQQIPVCVWVGLDLGRH